VKQLQGCVTHNQAHGLMCRELCAGSAVGVRIAVDGARHVDAGDVSSMTIASSSPEKEQLIIPIQHL
jgi:hypothetical protein